MLILDCSRLFKYLYINIGGDTTATEDTTATDINGVDGTSDLTDTSEGGDDGGPNETAEGDTSDSYDANTGEDMSSFNTDAESDDVNGKWYSIYTSKLQVLHQTRLSSVIQNIDFTYSLFLSVIAMAFLY